MKLFITLISIFAIQAIIASDYKGICNNEDAEAKKNIMHIGIKKKDLPKEVLKSIEATVKGEEQTYCKVVLAKMDEDDANNIKKHKGNDKNLLSYMVETEEDGNMVFYFFAPEGNLLDVEIQEPIGFVEPENPNLGDKPQHQEKK